MMRFLTYSQLMRHPLIELFNLLQVLNHCWMVDVELFSNFLCSCKSSFQDLLNCCCSVTKMYLILWKPMGCRTQGFPVLHYLPEFVQTHVHWVNDAIQPSHPLSSPSPPAFNLSQHQSLFQWVSSLHQVAKLLEHQLQQQYFQWIFRGDFL